MKAPIRISSYCAGEKLQILELCFLHLIDRGSYGKDHHLPRLKLLADLNECLCRHSAITISHWGAPNRHHTFPFGPILENLEGSGFVTSGPKVSKKGRAYMRQCSKRVRIAASKLSCDVLDRIAEAVR